MGDCSPNRNSNRECISPSNLDRLFLFHSTSYLISQVIPTNMVTWNVQHQPFLLPSPFIYTDTSILFYLQIYKQPPLPPGPTAQKHNGRLLNLATTKSIRILQRRSGCTIVLMDQRKWNIARRRTQLGSSQKDSLSPHENVEAVYF